MNVGPYMAYIFYIYIVFSPLYKKKWVFGVQNLSSQVSGHDGSAHTFGSSHQFLEVFQKGLKKEDFLAFFIRSIKTQFTHLKFGTVVN